MREFSIDSTSKEQVIDITSKIKSIVKASKLFTGICLVYTPHSTAAVIINESWDPNVSDDLLYSLSTMVPKNASYKHDKIDKNAQAHIKSTLLGPSESLTFHEGSLVLGRWQAIMFCEFDGPRQGRRVLVQLNGK